MVAMDRRRFLLAMPMLGAAVARAQAPKRPLRIGFISSGGTNAEVRGPEPTFPMARALVQGMRDLGYRYGADFVIEGRGGQGRPDTYVALARELVAANVDIIVAGGPTVPAIHRVTTTIPVVMVGGAYDPVAEKLVVSLAAPGGNITGLSLQQVDVVGKRLELLREAVPGSAPVGALWEDNSAAVWEATKTAAAARATPLLPYKITERSAIGPACSAAKAAGAGSLLVAGGAVLFGNASVLVQAANASRLPAMYSLRTFADLGGLMSYAADLEDLHRRAAAFVDRIAKGAKPATMPIEQPTQFELVVNLRAARAIGFSLPAGIVARAAHVIQ